MPKDRILYLDYLRIFAIYAVIVLHLSAVNWNNCDVNSREWAILNFYDSIVRWSVPVFIMISGSLFLGKQLKISNIYIKYIPRLFVAFIFWGFIYYIFGDGDPKENFLLLFSSGKTSGIATILRGYYHFWFIPMVAGLYICTPILKKIIEDETIGKYFLVLSFIFGFFIPWVSSIINDFGCDKLITINSILSKNLVSMSMYLVQGFSFYYIFGFYVLRNIFSKKIKTIIYISGILGFIFTVYTEYTVSINLQKPIQTYYEYLSVNVFMESLAIYELIKNMPFKNVLFSKFIIKISNCCFGIFLVHALVIKYFFESYSSAINYYSYWGIPTIAIFVFVISLVISAILKRIPIVGKYCI